MSNVYKVIVPSKVFEFVKTSEEFYRQIKKYQGNLLIVQWTNSRQMLYVDVRENWYRVYTTTAPNAKYPLFYSYCQIKTLDKWINPLLEITSSTAQNAKFTILKC